MKNRQTNDLKKGTNGQQNIYNALHRKRMTNEDTIIGHLKVKFCKGYICEGFHVIRQTTKHLLIRDMFIRDLFGVLKVNAWGMGDNPIFSVFSNIWSSVRLKIPSIPSFLAAQLVYIGYGQFKK